MHLRSISTGQNLTDICGVVPKGSEEMTSLLTGLRERVSEASGHTPQSARRAKEAISGERPQVRDTYVTDYSSGSGSFDLGRSTAYGEIRYPFGNSFGLLANVVC